MAKTRLPYAAEFRRRMVELVHAGRTPEELAAEFEPTAQSIRNWVAQSERNAGRGDGGLTTAEREELNRLRRENRQLRIEREILSKGLSRDWGDRGRSGMIARIVVGRGIVVWGGFCRGPPLRAGFQLVPVINEAV
jgi:transposase